MQFSDRTSLAGVPVSPLSRKPGQKHLQDACGECRPRPAEGRFLHVLCPQAHRGDTAGTTAARSCRSGRSTAGPTLLCWRTELWSRQVLQAICPGQSAPEGRAIGDVSEGFSLSGNFATTHLLTTDRLPAHMSGQGATSVRRSPVGSVSSHLLHDPLPANTPHRFLAIPLKLQQCISPSGDADHTQIHSQASPDRS